MKQNDFEFFYERTKRNTIGMQDCLYGIYTRVKNNPQNSELVQSFSELCYICTNMLNTLSGMANVYPDASMQKHELDIIRERLQVIREWEREIRQNSYPKEGQDLEDNHNLGVLE